MEQPYRYKKKLVKTGNSTFVLIPATSLTSWAKMFKIKEVREVIVEIYEKKIVILPIK